MVKKLLCLLLAVVLSLSLCACELVQNVAGSAMFFLIMAGLDDRVDKAAVFSFVQENRDELLQCIRQNDFSAYENGELVKSVEVDGETVDFFCGGAGMGSATAYQGFYYSPTDDLKAVWCAPNAGLTPNGSGFSWNPDYTDNTYYVEQICEHFFYYEATF